MMQKVQMSRVMIRRDNTLGMVQVVQFASRQSKRC